MTLARRERTVEIPEGIDLNYTIKGAKNPVMIGPDGNLWTTRTPIGSATLYLKRRGRYAEGSAWGDGAEWMLEQMPSLLGLRDDLTGFEPTGKVAQAFVRRPFRLSRTDRPWDALVGAILGQKVQVTRAVQSRRAIARRFGEPAPGPELPGRSRGTVLPSPATIGSLGYSDLHTCGVERKRAEVLIRTAREIRRLDALWTQAPHQIRARLEQIRGIGPWTSNMVTAVAFGDPDAVPVGDYHIPNNVAWWLAGEDRATDKRMLELLEPYRGHRWRVVRMAKSSGSAPRYGARLSLISDGMARGR
ncbi:MAG: DNA-3-methyladenine glycosylase 2 family protein [Acidimicrobiia bacterium]|nr:DNA-3-methyladenine glycosylase 2 family protein [Acidimicrobiia bacterium]